MGWTIVKGHWLSGPDQAVAPARFLNRHHLAVGQTLTIEANGRTARVVIVGEGVTGGDSMFDADWSTLPAAHARPAGPRLRGPRGGRSRTGRRSRPS